MANTNIKNVKPHYPTHSGKYNPVNLYKYIGDPTKIIYRSGWEKRFCTWCDNTPYITKWASEPFEIKYINPLDGKVHEYFVDFYIRQEVDGVVKEFLIEVKPKSQVKKPVPPTINTVEALERYNAAAKTWMMNSAKWKAAKAYAAKRGWEFVVATEDFVLGSK